MISDRVSAPKHATLAIASGSTVTVWNCDCNGNDNNTENDGTTTFDSFLPNDPSVVDLVWNHTGKVLCCVVETHSIDNDIIALLSAQSGRLLSSFGKQTPIQGTLAAAFGGKSRYLCMGTVDGGVLIWDLKKQAQARRFKISSPCLQVCLDPTDAFVFALGEWNLSIYRLREAKLVAEIQPPNDSDDDNSATRDRRSTLSKLSCFTISSQAPYLIAVGSHGGRVWIYDLSTTTMASNLYTDNSDRVTPPLKEWTLSNAPVVKLDFVGALNRLVVASENHVGVYEYQSGKPLFHVEFDLEMKRDQVTSMSCSGNLVAVGRASGIVVLWDWELKRQVASFDAPAPVQRIAFAPQGTTSPSLVPVETPKAQPIPVPARTPKAQPIPVPARTPKSQPAPVPVRMPKAQPVPEPVKMHKAQPTSHQPVLAATASSNNNDSRALPQTRLRASPDTTQQDNPTQPGWQENVVGMGSVQAQPITHQPVLAATGSGTTNNRVLPQTRLRESPETAPQDNQTQLATQENVVGLGAVQDMIRDEVDRVREDMQDAFRNLHVDMLRQFQMQSEDLNFALAKQLHSIDHLSEENRFLREENRSLQQENDSLRNR
jgi:WD40 repeat protein